jgi:heat-inducible transcriptional repressor
MGGARLGAREELVLGAIIDLYIKTGEPVASQAVARFFEQREGMSSATIRNVMAALGEAGLLEQPHASAGRTPTAAAFRAYVERFTEPGAGASGVRVRVVRFGAGGVDAAGDAQWRGQTHHPETAWREQPEPAWRDKIDENFTGVTSTTEFLERTSHVLALLSSGMGVALGGSPVRQILEHVHFSRLTAGRVLAVVVTSGGSVQDRVLALDRDIAALELETAARYLNENFRGWQVEKIRVEIARRMDEERAAYDQMLTSVEELCRKGALAGAVAGPTIYMEGMANLIGTEQDRERLKEMLSALETKQRLVELLTAYVDSREQEVRVVVGLDEASPAMQDLVLIAAPARLGAENEGTVALIAPTRIQYQQMIQAVRYVAGLPERIIP